LQIALPVRKLIGGEKAFKRMAPSVVKEAVLREGHPPGTPLTPLLSPFLPTPPCDTACGKQCPYSRAPDRQYLIIIKASPPC